MAQTKNFLDIVNQQHGEGEYSGDQFGGAAGTDGSGLPDGYKGNFLFATGIECSYPTIKAKNGVTIRRDLLEECGHYEHYKTDFQLTVDLEAVLKYSKFRK